jgi:hypothetical protein
VATRLQVITSAITFLHWALKAAPRRVRSSKNPPVRLPSVSVVKALLMLALYVELLALRNGKQVLGDELFIDGIYDQSISFEDLARELN